MFECECLTRELIVESTNSYLDFGTLCLLLHFHQTPFILYYTAAEIKKEQCIFGPKQSPSWTSVR